MIKFKTTAKNGKTLIGLGLSDENIKRMREGKPMYFSLEEMGIEGIDVTIVTGTTEDSIRDDLRKAGMKGI